MLKNTEFWMIQLVLTDSQGLYAEIIAEYPTVKEQIVCQRLRAIVLR